MFLVESVLGPVLFNMVINDLEAEILNFLSKLADNTELERFANIREDRRASQKDFDRLKR